MEYTVLYTNHMDRPHSLLTLSLHGKEKPEHFLKHLLLCKMKKKQFWFGKPQGWVNIKNIFLCVCVRERTISLDIYPFLTSCYSARQLRESVTVCSPLISDLLSWLSLNVNDSFLCVCAPSNTEAHTHTPYNRHSRVCEISFREQGHSYFQQLSSSQWFIFHFSSWVYHR